MKNVDKENNRGVSKVENNSSLSPLVFLLTALLFFASPVLAKGNSKGSLDSEELYFFNDTLLPILVNANICHAVRKDCRNDYILCYSADALSCDVYGIADEKVIKEILIAVLNSKLKVLSFTFWRSSYKKKTFFEKPLLEFIDRTGG